MLEYKLDAATRSFWLALGLNFVWINVSEVLRYFLVILPKLRSTFPHDAGIGAITPEIFASWMIWDTILVFAATGFYWLWFVKFRIGLTEPAKASLAFTITVFGLLWLGVVNMGLAPPSFIVAALPLAWGEQFVAALLTYWSTQRLEVCPRHP